MPSRRRVLIVDDDPDVRDLLQTHCLAARLEPECVSDAAAAIAKLEQEDYPIIVLDLIMPGGSGLEVLEVAEGKPDVKRIFVISSLAELWSSRNEYSSQVTVLAKPFEPAELIRRIYDVLQITDVR
jgi:two-component system phosphate regulon response regulator OmpR